MKFFVIFLFISISSLNASILYSAKNICIEDYFTDVDSKKFCYKPSTTAQDDIWKCITTKKQELYLIPNYTFDDSTWYCNPPVSDFLGLEQTQYNFLMALSGLIFSSILFTIIALFLVGF